MSYTLTTIGDYVVLSPETPYTYVVTVTGFTETVTGTGSLTKEFRWSHDGDTFSAWVDLTTPEVQKIVPNADQNIYVEFKYTLDSGGPMTIGDVVLNITDNAPTTYQTFTPTRVNEAGSTYGPVFHNQPSPWDPYALGPAIGMYQRLTQVINERFGHQVDYIRVVPDQVSKDIIFQTYTLQNALDPKCLKVLVPNNEFPDSRLNFNQWDFDWTVPFEVHIVKDHFETVFGLGTGPQQFDIIYFPLTNRFYEVGSSYLFKDFMQQNIYWKVALVDYTPKSSTKISDGLKAQLDAMTVSRTELFGEAIADEYKKSGKEQQFKPTTTQHDPVRESLNAAVTIVDRKIENHFHTVATHYYDLSSVFSIDGAPPTVATYKHPVVFPETEDRTFTCWFREKAVTTQTRSVTAAVVDGSDITITMSSSLPGMAIGEYVIINSPSTMDSKPIVGQVTNVAGLVVTVDAHPDVIANVTGRVPAWTDQSDLRVSRTAPRPFLMGLDGTSGIRVDSLASWVFRVIANDAEYVFLLTTPLSLDKWYAMVLNLSNTLGQFDLTIYTRLWESSADTSVQSTQLQRVFTKVKTGIVAADYTTDMQYLIEAGPMHLTNIRLMNTFLEAEQQSLFLNQYIVLDYDKALIVDNVVPQLNIPYIGNPK